MADYKLADILGIAGATIGIIIAAGIMLGNLGAKATAVFDRYRALTGEMRSGARSDPRAGSLRHQIVFYRKQILYLTYGSICVNLAVLSFLLTVTAASLAVMFPDLMALRTAGTVCLFAGLALIGVGMVLMLLETLLERPSIGRETSDLEGLPSYEEARTR